MQQFTRSCGEAPLRFVDCVDYGDAPTICVSGPADISLVDDEIQITYFMRVKLDDGSFENRAMCRLRLSWRKWLANREAYIEARREIMGEVAGLGSRVGMH